MLVNKLGSLFIEKLNPAQEDIRSSQGETQTANYSSKIYTAYETIEVFRRGCDMLIDAVGSLYVDVADRVFSATPIRAKKLDELLNYRPNPFVHAAEFKRKIATDLLFTGNAVIYWDGAWLYNIPANQVEFIVDKKKFISGVKYSNTDFSIDELIIIRDNAANNLFAGRSRLEAALKSVDSLNVINDYHKKVFDNDTVLNIVIKSKDVLSERIKQRKEQELSQRWNMRRGGKKPFILDGDMDIVQLSNASMEELGYKTSIETIHDKLLIAIGIPPILLQGGNNANIAPNLRLFYINTVIPLFEKILSGFELFYGFDLKVVRQEVDALRPELREEANWLVSLKNAGIISPNEARTELRREEIEGKDDLIDPVNVAGSAVNPTTGGRPKEDKDE
jgi:HK97 family phage portal protein